MQGNFWFLHTRVRERVRGALIRFTTQLERTRQFQATTRSARAISRDYFQNKFEFCTIDTAKKRNQILEPKLGRAEGSTLMHSPAESRIKGFSTLRVAPRCQYKIMIDHTRKFFIYTRKSTDTEDRQVRSISDQLAELKELAVKEQIEVVDIFVEKQTAKAPGRPVFNEMLLRIEANEANGILAWHPDRLARKLC